MEDKRIVKICSELDYVARSITTFFYIFFGVSIAITAISLSWLSGLQRWILFSVGIVSIIASFWLSCRSNDCVRIMAKVMEYYYKDMV